MRKTVSNFLLEHSLSNHTMFAMEARAQLPLAGASERDSTQIDFVSSVQYAKRRYQIYFAPAEPQGVFQPDHRRFCREIKRGLIELVKQDQADIRNYDWMFSLWSKALTLAIDSPDPLTGIVGGEKLTSIYINLENDFTGLGVLGQYFASELLKLEQAYLSQIYNQVKTRENKGAN